MPSELRLASGEARERLFFASPEAAERAGFRACKRCRPDRAVEPDRHVALVRRACETIAAAEAPPSIAELAAEASLSPFHFHRVFKKVTGVTPKAYAAERRARRAAEGLRTAGTVTEAIYDAGFNASSRFYEQAAARLGMTPAAARRGGEGRRSVSRSARPPSAPCSSPPPTRASRPSCSATIRRRWCASFRTDSHAQSSSGGDAGFERTVAQVVGLVEAPGQRFDLPLDIRGTAFQQQVWQALRAIPAGQHGELLRDRQSDRPAGRRARGRPGRAPAIRWRSRSPATGWCGPTATFPAIAGASRASAR